MRKTGREYLLTRFAECDDAIAYLRENPFPLLILLDLNLSGVSGHETLRAIKNEAKLCIIPVVAVTTSTRAVTDWIDGKM